MNVGWVSCTSLEESASIFVSQVCGSFFELKDAFILRQLKCSYVIGFASWEKRECAIFAESGILADELCRCD